MMIVCKENWLYCFMKHQGNKPPGMLPAKAAYMSKDIERLRDFYGIPLVPPSVSIKSVIFGLSVMQTQINKQRPTNTGMLVRGRVILILFGFCYHNNKAVFNYLHIALCVKSYHDRQLLSLFLFLFWFYYGLSLAE